MSRFAAYLCRVAACVALTAALPAPASAGSLQVDPVRLEINAGRRTATVRVRNQENAPVTIHAYALAWTQADGEDVYGETQAVIVSPPIFTIPGGATQLIRVGLRPSATGAAAYRLLVEEVPQASPAGSVQVALRLNLPLFAMIDAGTASELAFSTLRGADGRWTIEAVNRGRHYVRLETAAVEAATGLDLEPDLAFGVVLPGSVRRWTVAADAAPSDRSHLASTGRTNGGADSSLPDRR
jgi:fimbrial chaperone protein